MRVTVLRGISGAGKTTWVKTHAADAVVVSADHYFFVDGVYKFDPSKLPEFHNRCFRSFLDAVLVATPYIVVDNTNIHAWEYAPYVLAAQAFGYEVELLTLTCSIELSQARKNIVPPRQLVRSLEELDQETANMPKRFAGIHRTLAAF